LNKNWSNKGFEVPSECKLEQQGLEVLVDKNWINKGFEVPFIQKLEK
jgi:hypothetical protein